MKDACHAYVDVVWGDQEKLLTPHKVCNHCTSILSQSVIGKKVNFSLAFPWSGGESSDHSTKCYFCVVDARGFNSNSCQSITYPALESAFHPVPYFDKMSVPVFLGFCENDNENPSQYDSSTAGLSDGMKWTLCRHPPQNPHYLLNF